MIIVLFFALLSVVFFSMFIVQLFVLAIMVLIRVAPMLERGMERAIQEYEVEKHRRLNQRRRRAADLSARTVQLNSWQPYPAGPSHFEMPPRGK